jgi:uncharacterized protein (TIRG00374 family)
VTSGRSRPDASCRLPLVTGHWSLFSRLLIAAGLLAYTFWRSNPREVWHIAAGALAAPLVAAISLVLVDRALMAWRWVVLLRPLEGKTLPPFGTLLRIFFVSTFLGTFLPGSVGGDAVRAFRLSRRGVPAGDAVASVFLDRVLGVLSLLVMTPIGLLLARDLAANIGIVLALIVTAGACLATAVIVFSEHAEIAAARVLQTLPRQRARRAGEHVVGSMRRYSSCHRDLVWVLIASIAVQVLRVVQAYYLGVALGIRQPIGVYFMFVPLILLIMLLPITVNGIGTSQAAFVWLFGRAGTPSAEAFALSVLFVALGIVGNLPGAFLYAAEPAHEA